MMIRSQWETLPNGCRVVTALMNHVESVSMGVWVGAGGRCETKELSGASHFVEHLLFKGTKRRSAREISQTIEGRGGDINAFTQEESTCYYARVATSQTWEAMDVLLDMMLHSRFASVDIRKERDVVIEEIMMVRDQPHQQVEEMLGELMWKNHALGRPIAGTVETVRKFTRETLLAYKDRYYTPSNMVLAFAGKVDHRACVERVKKAFSVRGPILSRRFSPLGGEVAQHPFRALHKDIEQTHLALGFRGFGRHDPRRYALKLLSVILGENMSSRLFQVIREQHGLAYSIQCGGHLFDDTGAFVVTAGLDRDRLERALTLIVREIRKLKDKPVGKLEFNRARDYSMGQIQLGFETTTSQMMWVGEHILSYGRVKSPEEGIQALQAVSFQDVQRLAEDLLCPARCSLALVMPHVTEGLKKGLLKTVQQMS
ncbi:MAG: pitrilysin family protein [bacterium]